MTAPCNYQWNGETSVVTTRCLRGEPAIWGLGPFYKYFRFLISITHYFWNNDPWFCDVWNWMHAKVKFFQVIFWLQGFDAAPSVCDARALNPGVRDKQRWVAVKIHSNTEIGKTKHLLRPISTQSKHFSFVLVSESAQWSQEVGLCSTFLFARPLFRLASNRRHLNVCFCIFESFHICWSGTLHTLSARCSFLKRSLDITGEVPVCAHRARNDGRDTCCFGI